MVENGIAKNTTNASSVDSSELEEPVLTRYSSHCMPRRWRIEGLSSYDILYG